MNRRIASCARGSLHSFCRFYFESFLQSFGRSVVQCNVRPVSCASFDANQDGQVTVNELLQAVKTMARNLDLGE